MNKQEEVTIFEFETKYSADFAQLNYEWITEYFEVEEHDREILDNPFENVIKPGGQIFFAALDGKIVGTTALIVSGEETFELAKMAVAKESRGYKIGEKLMKTCLNYTKQVGRKKIILESNTKLTAAINLYKKFGFKEIPLDQNTFYKRVNIKMELILD